MKGKIYNNNNNKIRSRRESGEHGGGGGGLDETSHSGAHDNARLHQIRTTVPLSVDYWPTVFAFVIHINQVDQTFFFLSSNRLDDLSF